MGFSRRRRVLPAALAGIAALVMVSGCAKAPRAPAQERIKTAFMKAVKGKPELAEASILIHSDRLGIHELLRADPQAPDAYHVASVGKTFTAVLIGRLVDSGRLRFEDSVAPLLAPGRLDGLFVFKGVDHQAEVTVDQLLAHTSGTADYFADPAGKDGTIFVHMVREPEHFWTPDELLDFSRDHQKAVNAPGKAYHYSDTGYIILGLIVEKLYGAPFEAVLARELFQPLAMDRSFMPFRSEPASGSAAPIRKAWLQGSEVSTFRSISADWAGGGAASTEEDLLKFQKALWEGRLVSGATFEHMKTFDNKFQKGIYYGRGFMQFRFGEFMFLLSSWPKMMGHIGILSTHMLYDPKEDIHIIVNFGSTAGMESSVRLVIDVLGILLGRT